MLDDASPEVRAAGRMKLVSGGDAAVPRLLEALVGCGVEGRRQAAMALGTLQVKAAVPALTEAARKSKVQTQMGNQGHSTEQIRQVREWIQSGSIGDVKEAPWSLVMPAWILIGASIYFGIDASLSSNMAGQAMRALLGVE